VASGGAVFATFYWRIERSNDEARVSRNDKIRRRSDILLGGILPSAAQFPERNITYGRPVRS
jgi:hypothetical protein